MEGYLFKSTICLFILYVLYWGVLRSNANHQLNRFSVLLCLIFSFSFPFIPLGFSSPTEWPPAVHSVVQLSSNLQGEFFETTSGQSTNIYPIIYVLGLVVFTLRTIFGFYSLIRFYSHSLRYDDLDFKIVSVNEKISPFTFFNFLFLGTQQLNDKELKTLVIHEKCHKDYYHSIDVLIFELLTIIFWFNPIIWLFQKEMRIQHEFQADEHVLKSGVEPVDYQQLLFRTITGVSPQITNAFNKTSLTKRFNMMKNKKNSSKMDYFKAAFILPTMVFILAGAAFVGHEIVGQKIEYSTSTTGVKSNIPEVMFDVFIDGNTTKVNLKKGIPTATTNLTIRATPEGNVPYSFRVSDAEIVLVSGGITKSKIRSGGQVDLGAIADSAISGDYLAISVKEYQRRDKNKQIETIKLEDPVQINFPLY